MQYPASNPERGNQLPPQNLTLHQASRVLEIRFDDDNEFKLSFEMLRVFSPSAEAKGHGVGQEILQTGKRQVNILQAEPVGLYAIKFIFDDGHESGIYTWHYLYQLGVQQDYYWQQYLDALSLAGVNRDTPIPNKKQSNGDCGGCSK